MSDPLFHPVANLFPLLGEDELEVLAEDIGTNGLRQRPAEPMVPPRATERGLAMDGTGVRFLT